MKKFNKKGFTLIEMLVVIAIIAVLVAIVIPTVGDSTEKAREAADAANIRSYIAEVTTKAMTGTDPVSKEYTLTQQTEGWTTISDIAGKPVSGIPSSGTITITSDTNGNVTIAAK